MDSPTPWLTERQQQVWRRWLAVSARLPAALNHYLQAESGLSLPDFEVLAALTDVTGGRIRICDLAVALRWERSRLSHHLTRMEHRGLLAREECPDDGRGAFVLLTAAGRTAVEQAAPDHVRAVRDLVFDPLTTEELDILGAITGKVLARLEQDQPRKR